LLNSRVIVDAALERSTPLHFGKGMAGAVAGRPNRHPFGRKGLHNPNRNVALPSVDFPVTPGWRWRGNTGSLRGSASRLPGCLDQTRGASQQCGVPLLQGTPRTLAQKAAHAFKSADGSGGGRILHFETPKLAVTTNLSNENFAA